MTVEYDNPWTYDANNDSYIRTLTLRMSAPEAESMSEGPFSFADHKVRKALYEPLKEAFTALMRGWVK